MYDKITSSQNFNKINTTLPNIKLYLVEKYNLNPIIYTVSEKDIPDKITLKILILSDKVFVVNDITVVKTSTGEILKKYSAYKSDKISLDIEPDDIEIIFTKYYYDEDIQKTETQTFKRYYKNYINAFQLTNINIFDSLELNDDFLQVFGYKKIEGIDVLAEPKNKDNYIKIFINSPEKQTFGFYYFIRNNTLNSSTQSNSNLKVDQFKYKDLKIPFDKNNIVSFINRVENRFYLTDNRKFIDNVLDIVYRIETLKGINWNFYTLVYKINNFDICIRVINEREI